MKNTIKLDLKGYVVVATELIIWKIQMSISSLHTEMYKPDHDIGNKEHIMRNT